MRLSDYPKETLKAAIDKAINMMFLIECFAVLGVFMLLKHVNLFAADCWIVLMFIVSSYSSIRSLFPQALAYLEKEIEKEKKSNEVEENGSKKDKEDLVGTSVEQ